jgi:hypothetical protein
MYKITNTLNNLVYIGVTYKPKRRFASHTWDIKDRSKRRQLLKNAMFEHGKENFSMQILCIGGLKYCHELEKKGTLGAVSVRLDGTWRYNGQLLLPPETRGDVRRLCRCLGVELKEGGE